MERFIYPLGFKEARKEVGKTLFAAAKTVEQIVPTTVNEIGKEMVNRFVITPVMRRVLMAPFVRRLF